MTNWQKHKLHTKTNKWILPPLRDSGHYRPWYQILKCLYPTRIFHLRMMSSLNSQKEGNWRHKQYLHQTFVGGLDPGTGRGCWTHAAAWAGTCFLWFLKVVSGAGRQLVLHHLSAKGMKGKQRTCKFPVLMPRPVPLCGWTVSDKALWLFAFTFNSKEYVLSICWVSSRRSESPYQSKQSKVSAV